MDHSMSSLHRGLDFLSVLYSNANLSLLQKVVTTLRNAEDLETNTLLLLMPIINMYDYEEMLQDS
jgi:hypothetical protein